MKIKYTTQSYNSRDSRNKFISEIFSEYLNNKTVINIGGGGKKHLLKYIKPSKYTEIDIAGTPDIIIDLDKTYPLPIEDNKAECVVCTDVLEHLDEFHRVFKELLRISSKYIIISLPNAFTEIRPYIKREIYSGLEGKAGVSVGKFSKYYGLPKVKPEDRHRWFFSYTEIKSFFRDQQIDLNYNILEEVPIGASSTTFKGKIFRFFIKSIFGNELKEDLFYRTYWCILEKNKT